MLRTIGWISWMFMYLLGLLPVYFATKRLRTKGKTEEFTQKRNKHVGNWARRLLRNVGVQVEVAGAENLPPVGETVVYVSNHQSFLDIPILLGCVRQHGLLAKKEIGMVPLLRGWMGLLGCIYVDRKDTRASIQALKDAEKYVKDGHSFYIFPEGTRSKDGSLAEYKGGAVRIAYKAGVRVVPVVIDGSFRCLEYQGFRLRRGRVGVTILPPVETKGLDRAGQKALPAQLEAMTREVLEREK